MKIKILFPLCVVAVLASLLTLSIPAAYGVIPFQGAGSGPKVSEAETKALNAINTAPDVTAKLAGIADFVKKFPKSSARVRIAQRAADEISKVQDPAQQIALTEKALTILTADAELAILKPVLLQAYLNGKRVDDAFKLAGEILAKNPEDLGVLVTMTYAGTEQARQKNGNFVGPSLQYGLKAIELIEANKKPASMDDASWAGTKDMLPQLYQATAILNLVTGNSAEAKPKLVKASTLGSTDPSTFALLGLIINDEYTQQVGAYKAMPAGPAKQEALEKLESLLDNIIDIYAHAAGLASGRPEYAGLLEQVTIDLTGYYKYRHGQSIEGMQQLIDKYKAPKP